MQVYFGDLEITPFNILGVPKESFNLRANNEQEGRGAHCTKTV